MQSEEYFNQLKKLKMIAEQVNTNIQTNSNKLKTRMEKIINSQTALIKRADVLLQILFDHCQPELTEEEKKWFSELKHLSSIITKKHEPHIKQVIYIYPFNIYNIYNIYVFILCLFDFYLLI